MQRLFLVIIITYSHKNEIKARRTQRLAFKHGPWIKVRALVSVVTTLTSALTFIRCTVNLYYTGGLIKKGRPYSIAGRRVPELIPVLVSQPAGDVSHKPGGRLPLLPTKPAVTPPQPLRGLIPISLLGEQRHNGCEQFA